MESLGAIMVRGLLALLLLHGKLGCLQAYTCHSPSGIVATTTAPATVGNRAVLVALAKKMPPKASTSTTEFSAMGSTDADGYRRGTFGIGETESKILWGLVLGALLFGGDAAEERAAVQRSAVSIWGHICAQFEG